jgi:C4-dicarboxylate transporter DctQ subunit
MSKLFIWARKAGEGVTALLLAAMFITFVLQIFSRYVLAEPFGWTLELCLVLWVWIVFIGCAFVVREREHVTFNIVYHAAPHKIRKIMALISAAAVAAGLLWSLLPTWDWIDFLRIKKSATLKVPMRTIYSVYAVFLIVVAARMTWRFVDIIRNDNADADHELDLGEQK